MFLDDDRPEWFADLLSFVEDMGWSDAPETFLREFAAEHGIESWDEFHDFYVDYMEADDSYGEAA